MYNLTAVTALFGAIIHAMIVVMGQFSPAVLPLLILTVLYIYVGVFLLKKKRWAAWTILFVGVAGLVVTLFGANSGGHAPSEVFHAAAMVNFIAAVCAVVTLRNTKVGLVN